MSYPCTSCGQCCRNITMLFIASTFMKPEDRFYEEIHTFPYKTKPGTSECEKLTPEGRCSIYESRPDMCNIEKIRLKYFSGLKEEEFNKMNATVCNDMINKAGLESSYLIK